MKKTSFLAILLALTLLLCQFSFPLSMAVAELERCDAGDHDYELIDVNRSLICIIIYRGIGC